MCGLTYTNAVPNSNNNYNRVFDNFEECHVSDSGRMAFSSLLSLAPLTCSIFLSRQYSV
jgi:hypothetical protein